MSDVSRWTQAGYVGAVVAVMVAKRKNDEMPVSGEGEAVVKKTTAVAVAVVTSRRQWMQVVIKTGDRTSIALSVGVVVGVEYELYKVV
jgi:hypothetical protein